MFDRLKKVKTVDEMAKEFGARSGTPTTIEALMLLILDHVADLERRLDSLENGK